MEYLCMPTDGIQSCGCSVAGCGVTVGSSTVAGSYLTLGIQEAPLYLVIRYTAASQVKIFDHCVMPVLLNLWH